MGKRFFRLVVSLFFVFSISSSIVQAAGEKDIRVAILRNVDDFVLKIRGGFEIRDHKTAELLGQGRRLQPNQVKKTRLGLAIGKVQFQKNRVKIYPERDASIYVGKRRVRGEILIIADDQNKLAVVNYINLEDYIKGVLYHEISHKWPMEAIKAQAVAARTYALYSAQFRLKYDWDVTNDIYSQVYGGKDSERYRTNLAVDRTEGEILVYNDKILPAFFHADSGGYTEDASELWKIDIRPLRGVPSPYSKGSPHNHWKRNLRLADIQEKLNDHEFNLGLIKSIEILERNRSGRVRRLLITTRDGRQNEISGKDFRHIIGPNVIRSNRYRIVMQGYFIDFIGEGWGHGVGLDQWGAMGMSKRRYDYKEILSHYYPGAELIDYREMD